MDATAPKRRPGRPRKPSLPGRRSALGLRVTPKIKDLLDGVAKENGRTQSQEAEVRLENTFRDADMLRLALQLRTRGRPSSGLVLLLAEMLGRATHWQEHLGDVPWWDDPASFAGVAAAIAEVFDRLQPRRRGAIDENQTGDYRRHANLPVTLLKSEIAGKRLPDQECPQWLSEIIEELGPLAPRLAAPGDPPPGDKEKVPSPDTTVPAEVPKPRRAA